MVKRQSFKVGNWKDPNISATCANKYECSIVKSYFYVKPYIYIYIYARVEVTFNYIN